jgi:hypothetical protein
MITLVLVFIGDVPGRKLSGWSNTRATISSKTANSTVEVHSVWHDIYVATEAGGQMRVVVYYSARLRKSDRERARDLRRVAQILPQQFFHRLVKVRCANPWKRRVCCTNRWVVLYCPRLPNPAVSRPRRLSYRLFLIMSTCFSVPSITLYRLQSVIPV